MDGERGRERRDPCRHLQEVAGEEGSKLLHGKRGDWKKRQGSLIEVLYVCVYMHIFLFLFHADELAPFRIRDAGLANPLDGGVVEVRDDSSVFSSSMQCWILFFSFWQKIWSMDIACKKKLNNHHELFFYKKKVVQALILFFPVWSSLKSCFASQLTFISAY